MGANARADLCIVTLIPFDPEWNLVRNRWRWAHFKGVIHTHNHSETGPSVPQISGTLWLYPRTYSLTESDQIWHSNTRGRGNFLGVSHTLIPRAGTKETPNFAVLPYLCLNPLMVNDQIHSGNTDGGRVCFRGSAKPFHLHKCIVQSVSDTGVSCRFLFN